MGISPDGRFSLRVGSGGTNVWSFMVNSDGTIWAASVTWNCVGRESAGQRRRRHDGGSGRAAFHYHHVGIQMFDATGRLGGVIAKPSDKACVSVTFAGPGSVVALCLCQ